MEEYRLVLKSQLGPREGMLRVDVQQDAVAGSLTLLGDENPVSGVRIGEHTFRLFHHLHTAVNDLSCVSVFEVLGDQISGNLQIDGNLMRWYGEKSSERKA